MSKSRRLVEILLELQTRRRFTAAELAAELGVSRRTALRYLHELSEAGVPLAARPGPDGGYLVVRDRMLPPLAFTVDEAVSLFFAYQSLRNYGTLPFDAEVGSALHKLYRHLPADAQHRVDQMRERLDFATRHVNVPTPHLATLLAAAIGQEVLTIVYRGAEGVQRREIQPIGVYAQNGLWYCPAYCFTRKGIRLFRIDRVLQAEPPSGQHAPDPAITALTLRAYGEEARRQAPTTHMEVELTAEGVRQMDHLEQMDVDEEGGAVLRMEIALTDVPFFARVFLGMGEHARVRAPEIMLKEIRRILGVQTRLYGRASNGKGKTGRTK